MKEQDKSLKPYVIGLDLGGTNSVFGIVDAKGNIMATASMKTGGFDNAEDYVTACIKVLQPVIDEVGSIDTIQAMGIGAPNGNYLHGSIDYAPNLPWAHDTMVPLAEMFSQRLGIPVALTNDANAAAIGEMMYGVAQHMKNFIVLTLGTGVGSGIVIDGKLVYGSNGFAGELGHVATQLHEGRQCGCGRKDCLETYCSATGLARTAREMLEADARPSILRGLSPEKITSLDVSIAAGQGDEIAREVYDRTGHMLGEACADFAVFSAPEAFIFFGGMTKAGELLMRPIREGYLEHVHPLFRDAQFLVSGLDGSNAAVLGAAALGWGYSSLLTI